MLVKYVLTQALLTSTIRLQSKYHSPVPTSCQYGYKKAVPLHAMEALGGEKV
jgi:hypothetical protein